MLAATRRVKGDLLRANLPWRLVLKPNLTVVIEASEAECQRMISEKGRRLLQPQKRRFSAAGRHAVVAK